ncbi:MAG: hypothetical protein R3A10_09885 [Caldilineaceae bacterium]
MPASSARLSCWHGNERRPSTGRLAAAPPWRWPSTPCFHRVSMTIGAKKFDRYMLPALLALDVLAVGLVA